METFIRISGSDHIKGVPREMKWLQNHSSSLLLVSVGLLFLLPSCRSIYHQYFNHAQILDSDTITHIVSVQTIDQRLFDFEGRSGFYSPARHQVIGKSVDGGILVIQASEIVSLVAENPDSIDCVLSIVGGIAAVALIILAFV